jgi:hypothetical protein
MSNSNDKFKNSRRRQKDENAVHKQVKIAKSKAGPDGKDVKQPHRLAKKHAMDCGNPKCVLCGNPRKIFKQLTQQEKSLFQDLDNITDKKSNGLPPL